MDIKKYRVKPNKKVDLEKFSTKKDDSYSKKEVKEEILPQNLEKMFEFQEKLYAENKRGILVVLQAMDAAGKDSLVKKVFTALNPAGCKVTSFKQPSTEELDHDYLWRITKATPAYGEVGIFNRSHYEDVLVTRVHNLVNKKNDDDFWEKRFEDINAFEKYLDNNGIKVVKFFLHVSKDEQKERLLDRINLEEKHWKFAASDILERENWDDYHRAYEDMLEHTSTDYAPWYVVPADNKWYTRLVVSEVMLDLFKQLDPHTPKLSKEEESQLEKWKKVLMEQDEKNEK
ncbi:polyphosphate kinase 2 family protein [Finegoldia magna]|uniref:polyphosphate kinase 2 family protein n=1 Tax=Finegoldia magna TaxID=1260 RepID=UPI00290A80DA|nr:polyphosphate kinase 2 family protein [Finegoldia magna]MDU4731742.1 polyphosphate kinase 2 family protein [Finegoldia magna]MDU5363145.1 polyphosphate kinase 2 family protein [Finegoldia magna]MDU5442798.1 polyphosphate kinase 2 family protein [Finegoldia magna]MDU5742505.1 polyphosphate kinase 2 family protein [Finegoldia magna]